MMKKFYFTILFYSLFVIIFSFPCFAGCLVFSKPEFKGKVIDTETKQPIEGAVVVAIYNKDPIISGPAGGGSSIIHIKEVLTDGKGEFRIPAYTTLMGPNSREGITDFIIYKRGYGNYPGLHTSPPPQVHREKIFSQEIGTKGEINLRSFTYGVVELPKLLTWEERRRASRNSISGHIPESVYPLLSEEIAKERKWLRTNIKRR
ncbi:MAG: hypothetical protein P1P89_11985 [Desulfobacterales bacterium]|nr:hypothetical protein [Desulfobacterales bacterium]